MTFIRPLVDESTARARFEKRRFDRSRRLLSQWTRRLLPKREDTDESSRRLPMLEVVWLPYYRIAFSANKGDQQRTVEALIGGHEPSFAIFEAEGFEWLAGADREIFPPIVNAEEAVTLARDGLVGAIMRGSRWGRQPTLNETLRCTTVHYPFWAYYFARRGGILDVKMLDAVTGNPTGPKLKTALLAALKGAKVSGR